MVHGQASSFRALLTGVLLLTALLWVLAGGALPGEVAQENPRHFARYWIENFGALDETTEPLALRAQSVFQRVSAAADKRGARQPRLVLIRGAVGAPLSLAIPDGSIILSQDALRICYRNTSRTTGDARLAFVLGHELAHQAADDFWHAFAFFALEKYGRDGTDKARLEQMLKEANPASDGTSKSVSSARSKELRADSEGIVYMTMAGYDPYEVFKPKTAFFEEWVDRTPGLAINPDTLHPEPRLRAEFLLSQLAPVVEMLDLFHFGVRLSQLGRYEESTPLLETFKQSYPGREVLNDIGLNHLQLAVRLLFACDRNRVLGFRLPVVIDTWTQAEAFGALLRDSGVDCLHDENFLYLMRTATQHFEQAAAQDPNYLPARINLASACILKGDYAKALGLLDEALQIEADHAEALVLKAVALYLYGRSNRIDTAETAVDLLKGVLQKKPGHPAAVYNLAAILQERGHLAGAGDLWPVYLKAEPTGAFADAARRRAGLESGREPDRPKMTASIPGVSSPLPLGALRKPLPKRLDGARRRPFNLGGLSGAIWVGDGFKALQIVDSIELVEVSPAPGLDLGRVKAACGEPRYRVAGDPHAEALLYPGLAVIVEEDRVLGVVFFQSAPARP